jgi:glycosyltransferase involved in cell wall biosynthesis
MPEFSIVMPMYRGERHVRTAVESVQRQTQVSWELLAVDDGSPDASAEIIRELAATDHRIRLITKANSGVADARNRGFDASDASSRYVCFLDQDDVWEPDTLNTFQQVLNASPQSVGVHGLATYIGADGGRVRTGELEKMGRGRRGFRGARLVKWSLAEPTTFEVLAFFNHLCTPGVAAFRREALAAAGPFVQALAPCDDWDLYLRLTRMGPIAFVNKVVIGWRQHGDNVSADERHMAESVDQLRRHYLTLPDLTDHERRMMELGYNYQHLCAVRKRFLWAGLCMRRMQWLAAARHLRHACRSYREYRVGIINATNGHTVRTSQQVQ